MFWWDAIRKGISMRCAERALVPLILIAVAVATTSCAPVVSNLDPVAGMPDWPALPFAASVTVEPFEVPDAAGEDQRTPARYRDRELTQILREHRVFARTEALADRAFQTDLVLRGEIRARWDPLGAGNFFTWWPGGLVFAPHWRGTRMQFFAEARTELVDTRTGEIVGTYEASTAHEVVHRSASPGPFFGAALIFPNVIRGSLLTYPRERYMRVVYPIAYEALWQQMAARMVEDLGEVYAAGAKAREERCGDRLGLPPRIGQPWDEFVNCQSDYYEHFGEAEVDERAASVFVNADSGLRIYVIDGDITRWEKPEVMPSVAAPPPSSRR
jgi:hypothetical protein